MNNGDGCTAMQMYLMLNHFYTYKRFNVVHFV